MAIHKTRDKALKCSSQYNRTVARTGKWRGKKASEYIKYTKKKKKIESQSSKEWYNSLRRKYGMQRGNKHTLLIMAISEELGRIIRDQNSRQY